MLILALLVACSLIALQAWGPGTHMEFAERVYRRRKELLTSGVAKLLTEERRSFLYGNIAADIVNFKAFGGHQNHCHRWTIISEMRERATTPREEAFILGYLSHLAADTIAHNHFVPYHLVRFARMKGLGHLYWEMNADRFISERRWDEISVLKRDPELEQLDELINTTVIKKAFSMKTNKLIFSHVLLVSERERWRKGMSRFHPIKRVALQKGFLELFRKAAVKRIRLALRPRTFDQLTHIDTTGKRAQKLAMKERKQIAMKFKPGKNRDERAAENAAYFLQGMESPPPHSGAPHW